MSAGVTTLDEASPLGERGTPHRVLGEGVTGRRAADGGTIGFRTDIQGLRAVAVTLVVLYHCGVSVVSGGYVGVDVFFVISGFLITSHLVREIERTGRLSLTRFYARRVRRLLPPALLVVIVTTATARLWGPLLESTDTAREAVLTTFYSMNYHLAAQGVDYQQANTAPSPFQHFWSLAVEEQFYLAWPVIVVVVTALVRRLPVRSRRAVLATVVLAIVLVSLSLSVDTTASNAPLAYYSLHTRAWELGVGALIALVAPAVRIAARPAAALTWLGLAAVVAAAVGFDDQTAFPGSLALIPVLGAALVIVAGAHAPPQGVTRLLGNRPVQLVGLVSYGWYLWHWPLIILGPALYGTEFGVLEKIEVSLIAFWLALLTYLVVERPLLTRRLSPRRSLGIGAGLSAVAVVVAVSAVALGPSVQGDGARVARASASDMDDLTASLERAAATDTVPSNLQPSLETAETDVPQTSIDGCHVALLTTEQPPCVYGDTAADRTMVLFGDSHAEQWFSALDMYAEQNGWRLVSWTKVACPLADVTIENAQLGRSYTECDTWRDQRLVAIADLSPDLVVASQADSLVPYSFDDQSWAQGTARTLRTLADSTPNLLFLGDIARAESSVPDCLAAHLDSMQDCAVASDTGLTNVDSDYQHLPQRHQAVAREVETVDLSQVDTQLWTCLGRTCPPVVGSTLVYRDDAHLTQFYVRSIEPLLAGAIDAVLAGRTTRESTP